jgi:hypothetical protein
MRSILEYFETKPVVTGSSLLQNVTMKKVHDDYKAPELNGTSAHRTC